MWLNIKNRFAIINFSPNLNIRCCTIKLRQLKAMFAFTTLRLHLHTIEYRMPLRGEFRLEIFQFPYWLSNPKFRPPALSFGAQKKFRSESLTVHFVALMSLNWDVINLIQNCPVLSIINIVAEFVEFYLTHHCTGKWRPLSAFSRPSCMPMAPHSSTFLVLLVPWFPSFALTHTSVSNSIALHPI